MKIVYFLCAKCVDFSNQKSALKLNQFGIFDFVPIRVIWVFSSFGSEHKKNKMNWMYDTRNSSKIRYHILIQSHTSTSTSTHEYIYRHALKYFSTTICNIDLLWMWKRKKKNWETCECARYDFATAATFNYVWTASAREPNIALLSIKSLFHFLHRLDSNLLLYCCMRDRIDANIDI